MHSLFHFIRTKIMLYFVSYKYNGIEYIIFSKIIFNQIIHKLISIIKKSQTHQFSPKDI